MDDTGIEYEFTEYVHVLTIEEILKAKLPYPEIIAKNLFVRDDKKQNDYLNTVNEE